MREKFLLLIIFFSSSSFFLFNICNKNELKQQQKYRRKILEVKLSIKLLWFLQLEERQKKKKYVNNLYPVLLLESFKWRMKCYD